MAKCLDCGKLLEEGEEYLCDPCKDKAYKADMEAMKEMSDEEAEAAQIQAEQYDESWRFRDSRGRRVF